MSAANANPMYEAVKQKSVVSERRLLRSRRNLKKGRRDQGRVCRALTQQSSVELLFESQQHVANTSNALDAYKNRARAAHNRFVVDAKKKQWVVESAAAARPGETRARAR